MRRVLGALAAVVGRAAGAVAATRTLGRRWESGCPGTFTLRRHRRSARAAQAALAPLEWKRCLLCSPLRGHGAPAQKARSS